MSLRQLAEEDLGLILEDGVYGFGWTVELTAPDGSWAELIGYSNDVAQAIDPETGLLVSGRTASVALRVSSLFEAGFTALPRATADRNSAPWVVEFTDINGAPYTFSVAESNPDRALGLVTLVLSSYAPEVR